MKVSKGPRGVAGRSINRRDFLKISGAGLAGAALLGSAGCGSGQSSTSEGGGNYTFGAMLPLTGPAASIGEIFRHGLEMAVEEINERGGAGGMTLQPVIQDHAGTAQDGVGAMNQLVNVEQVPFVISSFSSVTLAAQPIAERNGVLMINTGGTESTLQDKPWLYTNQVLAPRLVPPLAQFAWDEGYRRAAMIYTDDAYGDSSKQAFTDAWQELGGEIVADESFPVGATDFSAQLTQINSADPDVVFEVVVGETQGLVVSQARSLGIEAPFIGTLATNALISAGGEAVEGFVDIGIAVDPQTEDEAAQRFIEGYQQRHDMVPAWPAGTIYETVYYLRDLIEAVAEGEGDPRNGEELLAALEENPEFQNFLAGGMVELTPDHAVVRTLAMRRVEGGEFQPVELVEPVAVDELAQQ